MARRTSGPDFKYNDALGFAQAKPGLKNELEALLNRARRTAKRRVKVKSGALRRSIHVTPIVNVGRMLRGSLRASARHALWHHDGVDGHPIWARPENKKGLLRFYWQREKTWFVGPMVNHPGHKANPFMRTALRDTVLRAQRTLR